MDNVLYARLDSFNRFIVEQMQHFFGKLYVQGYWREVSTRYSRSFQVVVSEMYQVASLRIAA